MFLGLVLLVDGGGFVLVVVGDQSRLGMATLSDLFVLALSLSLSL